MKMDTGLCIIEKSRMPFSETLLKCSQIIYSLSISTIYYVQIHTTRSRSKGMKEIKNKRVPQADYRSMEEWENTIRYKQIVKAESSMENFIKNARYFMLEKYLKKVSHSCQL